jgi:hypothetical protein
MLGACRKPEPFRALPQFSRFVVISLLISHVLFGHNIQPVYNFVFQRSTRDLRH